MCVVPDPELVAHVSATTGLGAREAGRVVDDVLAWYRESVEDYVRRRHATLHRHGVRNEQAFELIAVELAERVVAAPRLSHRQLRRLVYG
ncbi:MAG: hypothetical protein V9G19_06590 [Tetrasphaera sp.]